MKIKNRISTIGIVMAAVVFFVSSSAMAQDTTLAKNTTKNKQTQASASHKGMRVEGDKLIGDSKAARAAFITSDANMQALFDKAYAYVIFPNVGKGAIGIGGAAGGGIAFQGGEPVGKAKMKQVSVGFQFGGQAYREVIFFENQAEFDRFKDGKYEFAAQASAVAVTKGASGNVNFKNGVMVFTQEKKGAMYEAAIGGQKFSYEAFGS